ncbi:MAG: DUF4886 domain-containing protein [Clostridia bacterium]|nr:DUF4886 domain-containing protein [Clostridia bacterium]
MMPNETKKSLKILSVGNSFSIDTMKHLPYIAASLEIEDIRLGNLYIGGCSINRHCTNVENDAPAYKYYTSNGGDWSNTPDVKVSDAIKSEDWDWISIQHGTGDGSRYTAVESYQKLPYLVGYIRSNAKPHTKIAFNMAWVMEPYSTHKEICSYEGDQMRMYENLTELTKTVVLPTNGLDRVSPTGTAIQNARATELSGRLSRDGFHLSYGIGRYIAGLTFLKALTGMEIDSVTWMPEDVTEADREIAICAANRAIASPFAVSPMQIN